MENCLWDILPNRAWKKAGVKIQKKNYLPFEWLSSFDKDHWINLISLETKNFWWLFIKLKISVMILQYFLQNPEPGGVMVNTELQPYHQPLVEKYIQRLYI